MGLKIIEYKNQKVLSLDYRGLTEAETIEMLGQAVEMAKKSSKKIDMNALVHFEGVVSLTEKVITELKKTFTYSDINTKTAVVGAADLFRIVAQGTATFVGVRNVKFFQTEEEAKEWLVS